jgi:hypothetical protein
MFYAKSNEEADKKLMEFVRGRSKRFIFCPVINNQCNPNCICYNDPRTVYKNDVLIYVYEWRCSYVLISGELDINQ